MAAPSVGGSYGAWGSLLHALWGLNPSARLPAGCRLTKSADQTGIVTATPTAITWDQETWDTDAMHDLVTNTDRIVFQRAGLYLVQSYAFWESNATGLRALYLTKNGATKREASAVVGATIDAVGRTLLVAPVDALVADYVQILAEQTSGANRFLDADDATHGKTYCLVQWLGARS